MSVVRRGWDGHRARAPAVVVTERICEQLPQVHGEVCIVPQTMVVRGLAGTLDACTRGGNSFNTATYFY